MADADRVFLLLKGHMRRLREQLGVPSAEAPRVEHIAVSPKFQFDLAQIWEQYLAVNQALSMDNANEARQFFDTLESAVVTVDDQPLDDRAKAVWSDERKNLEKLIDMLRKAQDLKAMRAQFLPLSQEIGVLAKTFGFGEPGPIYELHCPMAFQGKGAVWYQNNDEVRNPYFGSTMLKCADRVERLVHGDPAVPTMNNQPH
jgi:Cu(I)/Ag(I) efflux system membrane fusion protein